MVVQYDDDDDDEVGGNTAVITVATLGKRETGRREIISISTDTRDLCSRATFQIYGVECFHSFRRTQK